MRPDFREPTVSVFIPCYRYARFLEQCVHSVFEQADVRVQVLILDDASPDDTPDVAARLLSDSRVEYRRHEINMGHIATYNEGVAWASGDYTVLLSADDLLTPGSLGRVTRALSENPTAGFAYGRVLDWYVADPKPAPSTVATTSAYRFLRGRDWIEECFRAGDNRLRAPEVIVRTDLHHEVGGYRPELPHTADFDMWLRLAARSDVAVIDADQAYYRIHGLNMHDSIMKSRYNIEQRRDVYDLVLSEHGPEIGNQTTLRRYAYRALGRAGMVLASNTLDQTGSRAEGLTTARFAASLSLYGAAVNRKFGAFMVRMTLGPRLAARVRRSMTAATTRVRARLG